MTIKPVFLPLLILLSSISSGQNKRGNTPSTNAEIPFYYQDGIKWSKKNNTPLLLTGLNDLVKGNTPDEMAMNWVSTHQTLLKIDDLNNLKVQFLRSSLSGHNVRLQQLAKQVPVYQSQVVVHISPQKKVTYVGNTYDPSVQNINTIPSLSKNEALQLAKEEINAKGKISFEQIDLFVYNLQKNTTLVYKVIVEPETPTGSWEILVNAHTGGIVNAEDKAHYHEHQSNSFFAPKPIPVNGMGNVFDPDPLSFAGVQYAGNYTDNNDATNAQLDAATIAVTLLDIDNTAGIYTLKGPYAEIQDFENPNKGLFTQGSGIFNFNRSDDAFEAVNCYYLIDKSMRYINVTLGISLMPFQYSGGVRYDPHGLNGSDNSHYVGGSGRIAFGEGGVDDAEDADVIIHELGHGIHDWLTGGNLSQVDGLSEGSGDYWGQSYSRSLGQWTPADAEYNWFFNWDGHNPFWNGRITNYTATYPGGLVGQIHTDGQIWATCLMRIYDILGKEKVDKAFLEGLAMTGSNTSQQDAAIAVRQAAIDMGYSCPDIDVFTQEFTTTGYNMPPLDLTQFPPIIPDTTQCDGVAAIINGNGYSLNWYDDFGLTNLLFTGNNLNTGQSTSGTYTYYVKYDHPACSLAPADTVVLTITNCAVPPVASFSASDSSICIGDCIDLTDLSTGVPAGWTWYFPGSSTPSSGTQHPTSICYSAPGNYDVALVVSNSNGSDSLFLANFIMVNPNPVITASPSLSICSGDTTMIAATGTATSFSWDNGLGAGLSHNVTPTTTTTYTVTGTDPNGCMATDQVTVTVNPLPIVATSGDTTICLGDSITISATGTVGSFIWDNGLGNGMSHTVSPATTTTYTVSGTDANNCSNTASLTVTVTVCVGFNEENPGNIVQVYPNPTQQELFIVLKNINSKMEILLTDNLGRVIYQDTSNNPQVVIQTADWARGMYLLRINTGNEVISKKIIKE